MLGLGESVTYWEMTERQFVMESGEGPLKPAGRRKRGSKALEECSQPIDSSSSSAQASQDATSEFGGAAIHPVTGKEYYFCAKCGKEYGSDNGRSIWKRHIAEKHGVPLSSQPHKSRWDRSELFFLAERLWLFFYIECLLWDAPANAAITAQSEAERRARTLESKRKWAAKNRQRKKAAKADSAKSRAPTSSNASEPVTPEHQSSSSTSDQIMPEVDLTHTSKQKQIQDDDHFFSCKATRGPPPVVPSRRTGLPIMTPQWQRNTRPTPSYNNFDFSPPKEAKVDQRHLPSEANKSPSPPLPASRQQGMPQKDNSESAAYSLLGLRSSSPVSHYVHPEFDHNLPSSPPSSPPAKKRSRSSSYQRESSNITMPPPSAPDTAKHEGLESPARLESLPPLSQQKRKRSMNMLHGAQDAPSEMSDSEVSAEMSLHSASTSSSHPLSTPHQSFMSMRSANSIRSSGPNRLLADAFPMSSIFKSRTNVRSGGPSIVDPERSIGRRSAGAGDFSFHMSSPMSTHLSKSLGLVPDEAYYAPQDDQSEPWPQLHYHQ